MPGVLCLAPARNADKSSSVVIGCSSRSGYFVGQVSVMTPCSLVTCLVYIYRLMFPAKLCYKGIKGVEVAEDIVALHI
jgi:hypothetical protein